MLMLRSQKRLIYFALIVSIITLFVGLLVFGAYKLGFYSYFIADRAFTNKNYDNAINYYRILTQSNSYLVKFNPEIYYKLGFAYLLKNKYYLAGANFNKFLRENKDINSIDSKKKFIIGATFAKTGRYHQAKQLLEAISPDESDRIFYKADYYNLLAESYLNKKEYDLALKNANKTLVIRNVAQNSLRTAHIIKFLTFWNKGDADGAQKEAQILGGLSDEDLDVFQLEFYENELFTYAQKSGILQQITNESIDVINQSENLSPTKKAIIFTVWATFHRGNNDFSLAEFLAKKAIEADPDYLPAYYEMGSTYSAQQRFDIALEYDQQASKIDPEHPLVRTGLGWIYYNLAVNLAYGDTYLIEKMRLAEENYLKALEIDPTFSIAHNNLGLVYLHRNQCDRANERFNLAIKYDPTYYKAINNIGGIFMLYGDYNKAVEYFNKALEINPYYAKAFSNIGEIYSYYEGKLDRSTLFLQKAIELDSYMVDAMGFIAKNYSAQGDYKKAIEYLEKAISISPNYPWLYFLLSDVYKSMGETQKSQEVYEKAMSLFLVSGEDYIYHYNRGIEHKNAGKIDLAAQEYEKSIELQPDFTDPYINLSRIYEKKYGTNKSIEVLKRGLKEDPESLLLYDELGYIYMDNGDLDNALAIFQGAATKLQGNCDKTSIARIYEAIGLIYYDMKKFDLALNYLNKAKNQDPYSSTIYTNLGATYLAKGDSQNAIASLKTAIQLNPDDAVAHNNLGDILAQQGKIGGAIVEFKKALEIDPNLKIAQENLARYQKR